MHIDIHTPPFFTLVYATYRPGGMDLLGESLKDQPPFYELVVVDRYPGRVERGKAAEYLKERGIPLRYFGPPSVPGLGFKTGQARAWNVGAMLASTEHVIYLQDFCWSPAGFMMSWLAKLLSSVGNVSICGSGLVHIAAPPEEEGDISVWKGSCWHKIGQQLSAWEPTFHELFNTYFPIYFFEETDGLDERSSKISDAGQNFLHQLIYLGMWPEVDKTIRVGMIDHHRWGGPTWNICEETKHDPRPRLPFMHKSPNGYCFKEVWEKLLKIKGYVPPEATK